VVVGRMGLKADAGIILKIEGDAGGCDDNSDASEDGGMGIEGDAGGDAGDYGESGIIFPDGLDLDLSGRNACGDGSDGDGGEDGRMDLEADSGAVSEAQGGADDAGGSGQCDHDMSCGARDTRSRSTALKDVEGGVGDRGATKDTHAGIPRSHRSVAAKRERNYNRVNRRRAALERRALEADGPSNDVAAGP
jgi:hypothetical protein